MTTRLSSRLLLLASLVSLLVVGCQNYGTKLTFKKGEVYYTDQVTEAEAKKLGNYLVEQNYFDDQREKAVQLTKVGGTYQVRMVVDQDSLKAHPEYESLFGQFTGMISTALFSGAPVEIHLCDATLETLKTIPYQKPTASAAPKLDPSTLGTRIDVNSSAFFYSEAVDKATAEKTANYLKEDGLFDGRSALAQLDRTGDTWKLRVVFNEGSENDPAVIEKMKAKSKQLSTDLFSGAPTEIHLTDDALQTKRMISSAE